MKDVYLDLNVNKKNENAVSLSKCFVSTLKQFKTKESCPKKLINNCLRLSYLLFDIKKKSYKSSNHSFCKLCHTQINNKSLMNTLPCACSFHYRCLKSHHISSSVIHNCPTCSF